MIGEVSAAGYLHVTLILVIVGVAIAVAWSQPTRRAALGSALPNLTAVNPETHARRRADILASAAVWSRSVVSIAPRPRRSARAGSARASFHYFPDKAAIFRASFADDFDRTSALVDDLEVGGLRCDLRRMLRPVEGWS